MQRKFALLGLAIALIGLALWFAFARGASPAALVVNEPERSTPVQNGADVTTESHESPRASETREAPLEAPRLHVRSSAGIPLAFVEIERAGRWQRVELVDGVCDASGVPLPARIRAPGHVTRPLERADVELVLEPDALLLIEGADLRACLAELSIEEDSCERLDDFREARTRAIASGWISNTSFGIALACERLEPLPPQLDVRLVRTDRMRMYLTLEPKPGLRGRWELPCEGRQAGTALEIRVERPPGLRGPVSVQLECPAEAGTSVQGASFPWGNVGGFSLDLFEERTLAGEEEVARFPFALPGRKHFATALDTSSHAYGRVEFVHDGNRQLLRLREGLEFRGRVVEAQTRLPLRSVYLRFQGVGTEGWVVEAQHEPLAQDGSFVLRGPKRISAWRVDALEPPASFVLVAQAPGYDDLALQFERSDPRVLDVGEVALVHHRNPVVLAAGHGLSAAELDGHCLVFADMPEEAWRTLAGVALEDGRLEIEFPWGRDADRAKALAVREDLLNGEQSSVPFERALGPILFVHVVDDVRTFRLESDGLYHRVPETKLELTLQTEALAPEKQSWRIGWSWNGGWISAGMLASNVTGQQREVQLTVPEGAQQLWWSATGIPPDLRGDAGGFQTIRGTAIKLVLH